MKKLIKTISILLLGTYSFALGQDVYPYFSDSKKQFEFEKKRIYIKEINEKEQVISGGSTFNPFYLIDESQPAIVPGDIKTTYKYNYDFNILQDGRFLTEIEFLRIVGLKEEADNNLYIFERKIANWEKAPLRKQRLRYKNSMLLNTGYIIVGLGVFSYMMSFQTEGAYDPEATSSARQTLGIISGLIGAIFINLGQEKFKYTKPPKPTLKQSLTNNQIIGLSESYNKRIYEEIKNAN